MKQETLFYKTVLKIAVPITLQSVLQSSFSIIDQLMIGQLGSVSIAGIGLAGKFSSIFSVLVTAIASVAGIMISQYLGQKEEREVSRSFWMNMLFAGALAILFTVLSTVWANPIMGIYSTDVDTRDVSSVYLSIVAFGFIPRAIDKMVSTMLCCMEMSVLPLAASIVGAVVNTVLNYVLIFGKFGAPALGVEGAAIATLVSHIVSTVLILILFCIYIDKKEIHLKFMIRMSQEAFRQYLKILLPIFVCELLWTLGENVYAAIYGRLGTDACAAMTLTTAVQVLMIGLMSGLAQAAGIVIGKTLGKGEQEQAYKEAKKVMCVAFFAAVVLSVMLLLLKEIYVDLYQVEDHVKEIAKQILIVFAIVSPIKVLNMTLGGGILRSGGDTFTIMLIDFTGTWLFGVPLGLVTAFVLGLSIPYVYFFLSLEEGVRLFISFIVFHRKKWMKKILAENIGNS